MSRCARCHAESEARRAVELVHGATREAAEVCSDGCEAECRRVWEYAASHVVPFFVGTAVLPLLGLLLSLLMLEVAGGGLGLFVIFAGLGAVIIKYPFATPQTFDMFGARRTIALVKGMGWALILGGAIAAVLSWLL